MSWLLDKIRYKFSKKCKPIFSEYYCFAILYHVEITTEDVFIVKSDFKFLQYYFVKPCFWISVMKVIT